MSGSLGVCKIPESIKGRLKKFRFDATAKTNALILKIDRENMELFVETELKDTDIEGIRSELPAQQPRFVVISYELKHADGRLSYPMCLLFYSPLGSCPEMKILYVGSLNNLVQECELVKSATVRELDEITQELLNEKFA